MRVENSLVAERIQKILSRAGLGSRRSCEELISEGRVTVNRHRATLGDRADPTSDEIRVDNELLPNFENRIYIALYKPVGTLSSRRSQGGRRTVVDLVHVPQRLYPVGRLDADSEGLILLTNDGDLTNRLTHPRYGHEKEYRVWLNPKPSASQLDAWGRGIIMPDGIRTLPAQVWLEKGTLQQVGAWIHVVMREGRKRQIRETARSMSLQVRKLIRIRMANILLGDLQPGEWRHLTTEEVTRLQRAPAADRRQN